jgi:pimeloyl-ACP methyl ester carboxylesterase
VKTLVLMDTKAGVDTEEGRAGRLKSAEEILQKGPGWAIEQIMPKLLAPVTVSSRLDVLESAKRTMQQAGAAGMAAMQRGMAERVDSALTLGEINVPVLVLGGEFDAASPVSELERMQRGIRGAELKIVGRAGHFAAFEQPDEVGRLVRDFLEKNGR